MKFLIAKTAVFFIVFPFYSQTNTWTGATDTDWHKACNWSLNLVPTCSHDVVIPDLANDPNITGIAHCKTIEVQGSSTLLDIIGTAILEISNSGACVGVATIYSCCSGGCGGQTSMTDSRDGKTYNIIQTGTGSSIQCWMAKNLDYSTSGGLTPLASGQGSAGIQKYCYNDNAANCTIYGGLYEWAEMMNGSSTCNGDATCPPCPTPVQGICPTGWHIPSHYEWTVLEKNIGSNPGAFPYDVTTTGLLGTNEGGNLKQTGTVYWNTPNTGATNSSGFTALPAGYSKVGAFGNIRFTDSWWTTTESSGTEAWMRWVYSIQAGINRDKDNKGSGYSVRCVKD